MKRKLVKQGAATLMVSLPSKWAKENGLDKGDEVEIEEQGKGILIRAEESQEQKKMSINLSGYNPLINKIIISLYIKGIDELEIRFNDKKEIELIKKHVIEELLGFEIIKQTNNSILLNDITDAVTQEIDDIIKRIFFILKAMGEELINSIENKEKANQVVEMDHNVNKFVYFCLRMLNLRGYKEYKKTTQMYGIVSILEEIGDIYKKIATELEKKNKIDKNNISVMKDILVSLELFEKLLFGFEKETAVKFANNYELIKRKIKGNGSVDGDLARINESIIRMNNYLLVNAF